MTTEPLTEPRVLIELFVPGRPRTKGSLNAVCTRNRSHTIHFTEQVTDSKSWRGRMARAMRETQLAEHGRFLQYADAVYVTLAFRFDRPETPAGRPSWPTNIVFGDLDKLTRNTLDAMLTPEKREGMELCSALLADDSLVATLAVSKRWATEECPAGVRITVVAMPDGRHE